MFRRTFMQRTPFEEKPLEVNLRKWLIWQLDIQTSRILRQRDRKCVTCGSMHALQCSNFYSRRYLIIRFDLRNCNAQCSACNMRHNSDPFLYLNYMQEHYGPDVVAELHSLRMSLQKVTEGALREMLEDYQKKMRLFV